MFSCKSSPGISQVFIHVILIIIIKECTLVSVVGNFLTMVLMAGSSALSVKKPGLDFESEHACKVKRKKIHKQRNIMFWLKLSLCSPK